MDPDQTPFFSDFKDAKKIFLKIFFSYTLAIDTLSSFLIFYFLLQFCVKLLITFRRKGKYPEPDPDADLYLMDPDGPKTSGS